MKVRIQAFIDGPGRSYAYYPGQVIVDHEHAADWVARGQAVEIETPPEKAVLAEGETADEPEGEVSGPAESETPDKKRKRR